MNLFLRGSTLLDYAIANRKNGGVPVGRITELSGDQSSGKSLLCLHLASQAQKQGGIAVFIDTEHDLDRGFAVRVGVDWNKFVYKEKLSCLEDVFKYIETTIKKIRLKYKDRLVLIVWDSIAATPARIEIEDDSYDPTATIGLQARIMSKALRKIRESIKTERIALVCTNQLRTKIGGTGWGDNSVTSHGRAMGFYSSVRVRLKAYSKIVNSKTGNVDGIHCFAEVVKNKIGPGFRKVKFPMVYSFGVDDKNSWRDLLIELEEIKGKAWREMTVGETTHKFRSSEWKKLLKDNPEVEKHVLDRVDKRMIIVYEAKEKE